MLVFVGSCRNREDQDRIKDMQDLCKHLSLENNVQFKVNVSYDELKKELQEGTIGLHAMWNEHFGIGKKFVGEKSLNVMIDLILELRLPFHHLDIH